MINGNAADRRREKRAKRNAGLFGLDASTDEDNSGYERNNFDQQKKENDQMSQEQTHWYTSSGGWTAIFTAVLCLFTFFLWRVSDAANGLNAANQRAMVNFNGPGVGKTLSPDGKTVAAYQVLYAWSNSGRSPAKSAISQYNASLSDLRPDRSLDFDSLPTRETLPLIVGPGTVFQLPPVVLTVSDLEDVSTGKKHLFFWGWITYKDGIPDSPTRLTEFCTDVTSINWGSGDHNSLSNNPTLNTPPCAQHNCYYEECGDYAERVKK